MMAKEAFGTLSLLCLLSVLLTASAVPLQRRGLDLRAGSPTVAAVAPVLSSGPVFYSVEVTDADLFDSQATTDNSYDYSVW